MGLKYSMKIKVRCKEKLSDNKDRLLRETVETVTDCLHKQDREI